MRVWAEKNVSFLEPMHAFSSYPYIRSSRCASQMALDSIDHEINALLKEYGTDPDEYFHRDTFIIKSMPPLPPRTVDAEAFVTQADQIEASLTVLRLDCAKTDDAVSDLRKQIKATANEQFCRLLRKELSSALTRKETEQLTLDRYLRDLWELTRNTRIIDGKEFQTKMALLLDRRMLAALEQHRQSADDILKREDCTPAPAPDVCAPTQT